MVRYRCKLCKKIAPSSKTIIDIDGSPYCTRCSPIKPEEAWSKKKEKKKGDDNGKA